MMYKLMRGLSKRKFIRDTLWLAISFIKKSKFNNYKEALESRESSVFSETGVSNYVNAVRHSGGCEGPTLPSEYVAKILHYANENVTYADRDPSKGFLVKDYGSVCDSLGKEVLVAQYFNTIDGCAEIAELANDPLLLKIAADYLKVIPKLVGVNLWWSFPAKASEEDKAKHAHVFHYDLDDIKFIKFFFYITDVGKEDGPHVYVSTSNRDIKYKNTWFKSKRFTDREVVNAYGEDKVKVVTGPAGSCLIEDTITLHKGMTSERNPRLVLQLQYAVHNFGKQSEKRALNELVEIKAVSK